MRLFSKVDGTVDRFERAGLMTPPFDLSARSSVSGPAFWVAGQVYSPGFQEGQLYPPGFQHGEAYHSGYQAGEVFHPGFQRGETYLPGFQQGQTP